MGLDGALARFDADTDRNCARRKALYQQVSCFFRECQVDLLSFEDVRKEMHLAQKIYRGVQEIPVDRIRGSVGRYDDFTSAFLPRKGHLRERWERVDRAMMAGETPPIEVYQVGDAYFVLDGNHRVSIARQHRQDLIEAEVWEYPRPRSLGADVDILAFVNDSERSGFLAKYGQCSPQAVQEIVLTCARCYEDLASMIEAYRRGLDEAGAGPVSTEQAVSGWYSEVYAPAIAGIRQNDLLARFPDRTEADLFIWAWKNNQDLEEMARAEGIAPVSGART